MMDDNKSDTEQPNDSALEKNTKDEEVDKGLSTTKRIWRTVKKDVKSAELWKMKILFLLNAAAWNSLGPFLTIHLRSIGVSIQETSYIYTVMPMATVISPPIVGIIGDTIGNYKMYLATLIFLIGLTPISYILLPVARERIYLPHNISASLVCEDMLPVLYFADSMCPVHDSVSKPTLFSGQCFYDCGERGNTSNSSQPLDLFAGTSCDSDHCTITLSEFEDTIQSDQIKLARMNNKEENPTKFKLQQKQTNGKTSTLAGCTEGKLAFADDSIFMGNDTCKLQCEMLVSREDICSQKYYLEDRNVSLTFWLMMVFRTLLAVFYAGYSTLLDGAMIMIVNNRNADLGLQHIWWRVGGMVFSPLSGYLIDYMSQGKDITDYSPAFYLFAVLNFIAAGIVTRIDLSFKLPSSTVLRDLGVIIKNVELVLFCLVCGFAGFNIGYVENFLFWFLEELGSGKGLMGVTVLVGTASGIPWLLVSGIFLPKIGHVLALSLGMFAFAIRFLGYSLIHDPVMCLPYEALECFTTSIMMMVFDLYAYDLSTPNTIASVMGISWAMYLGVGRGIGTLLGGLITPVLGSRKTFQLYAIVSLIVAVLYTCYWFLYLRNVKKREKKEAEKKEMKAYEQEVECNDELSAVKTGDSDQQQRNSEQSQQKDCEEKTKQTIQETGIEKNIEEHVEEGKSAAETLAT